MNNPALYLKEQPKIKPPAGASQTAAGKDFVARTLPPYSATSRRIPPSPPPMRAPMLLPILQPRHCVYCIRGLLVMARMDSRTQW